MTKPGESRMPRWLGWSLLLLILIGATTVRFYRLDRNCYFFDETWIDELSTGRGSLQTRLPTDLLIDYVPKITSLAGAPHWWTIWTTMDHVTHPPLFMIILRWWREIFGESPAISRACSATFSVLAILLLFDVVRNLHGRTAALWACAIMALAGPQIELAQEVRMYTLLLVLSLAAISGLVRIEKFGVNVRRCLALLAATLGMALTHYFAIPAAAMLGIYAMIRLRDRERKQVIISFIVAGAVFLIGWGPFFWQQRASFGLTGDNWLQEDSAGHVARTLWRLAKLPHELIVEPSATSPIACLPALLLAVPFAFVKRRPEMLIWCLWLCGTLFFIAALDLTRSTTHLVFTRYALIGSPAIYVALVALFAGQTQTFQFLNRIGPFILGALVLACALAIPKAYEERNTEYRGLTAHIDSHIRDGEPVIFYATTRQDWYASVLYLNTSYYAQSYPWPFMLVTKTPSVETLTRLRALKSFWLLDVTGSGADQLYFPDATIDSKQHFPGLGFCERITPMQDGATTAPASQLSPALSFQP